jgi:hypothetical protein
MNGLHDDLGRHDHALCWRIIEYDTNDADVMN